MNLIDYIPHRQDQTRCCADCGCLLSTGNLTFTCWPRGKTWSQGIASYWEQAEAFAQLMEIEPA